MLGNNPINEIEDLWMLAQLLLMVVDCMSQQE
jgi:hypothetical protein